MTFRRRLSLSIVALILALVTAVSFNYLRYLVGMQLRFALQQAEMVAEQVRSAALEAASEHWQEESGDFARDLDHVLAAQPVRCFRDLRIFLGPENDLRQTLAIAQIDEDHPAEIAVHVDPAG